MLPIPGLSPQHTMLAWTAVAVALLIFLVAKLRLNAFVGLLIASVFVGLTCGMKLTDIGAAIAAGVGGVLGGVAIVVGLGTIIGKLLAESGGAEVVARTLIRAFGERRLPVAFVVVAFVVGLPVWFTVGLVLLAPILYSVVRETKTPLTLLGIPMVAGLAVAHGLVPPHPGPLAAIELLKADAGKTILYSILIGVPTALIAGPLFAKFISPRVPGQLGGLADQLTAKTEGRNLPGFGLALVTILLPIVLMLAATVADVTIADKDNKLRQWMDFIGSPTVAMLAGLLFALWSFGTARGFNRAQLEKFSNECLGPVALVVLIVGAGGGFKEVLMKAGVGGAIKALAEGSNLSPIVFAWFAAVLMRVATGSATVAITTAAGLMVPILEGTPGVNKELVIIAMGCGSSILSHVNDGGFWFVKEYLNMTVEQTFKTWTVMETIVAVAGLLLTLAVNAVV
jgi:GntP family gluconate:H+ symporter